MATPFGVVRSVIHADANALRFEKFCNDLVSVLEGGRLVVSTSTTWDRGRDGRTIDPGPEIVVCTSLVGEVDDKATSDVKKVAKYGTPPAKLYFCSSQNLSEQSLISISAEIRGLLPAGTSVTVFGSRQLAEATARFEQPLATHYLAEVDATLHAWDGEGPKGEAGEALQLALSAMGQPDSTAIRHGLYRAAILMVLSDGVARNVAEVGRDVAARLHLSRSIPDGVIGAELDRLNGAGEVAAEGSRFTATESGRTAAEDLRAVGGASLVAGKKSVRNQLQGEIGYALDDGHFNRLWSDFQDRTAYFFYVRGQAMVSRVSSILEGAAAGGASGEDPEVSKFVEELAASAAATAPDRVQAEQLRVAVSDIFSERSGPAFEWLASTSACFLGLCSLGLEATSGEQLRQAVSRMSLVPDTDVLLSYLCEGEPEHKGVREILTRWKAIGGDLLLAKPVLEEVAYHAWIAPNDFREVEGLLPGEAIDRIRLIQNAFTRAFASMLARGIARSRAHWPKFLSQFRGRSGKDASVVRAHLVASLPFFDLPPVSREGADLQRRVMTFVLGDRALTAGTDREAKIAQDKARRDADLYVSIVEHSSRVRQANPSAAVLLLTSSGRLRDIEAAFPGELADELVLSIPTVLHVLSLIPGVALGVEAMRALLFEDGIGTNVTDMQRVLLRAVKLAQSHTLPWASRTLLEGEIRKRVVDYARSETTNRAERKERAAELEAAILHGKETAAVSSIVGEALAAAGAETSKERQLAAANAKIRELERELARRDKAARSQPGKKNR